MSKSGKPHLFSWDRLDRVKLITQLIQIRRKYFQKLNVSIKNLYNKREVGHSAHNFFDDSISKLSNLDKNNCEGLITEAECISALKNMNNQKSPGSDGITVEFYKLFWNDVKEFYINFINHSFHTGSLTDLQKQSIITLIPKQNKDITSLENWRPISLLNVDYKIATKVIANRVKSVISSIIHNSQTGFIKGRYIGENIRLLFKIIDNAEDEDKPGLIFFSDFEKAFDSVDHTFIISCLKHFNFGEDFIKWVKLFYHDAKSCVSNNGNMSKFFPIRRGVRQGCPLSTYLFIICIELLSHKISTTEDIKGIFFTNMEFKKSLFADDASFILDGSFKSFQTLIDILDNFSYISGLKINAKMCQVLRIGSMTKSNVVYLKDRKYQWSSTEASSLGMTFGTNKENIFRANLEPKIKLFEKCLKQWQHRKLTLMGKITVIKNYALPKLVYVLSSLPDPNKQTIKRIETIMYDFLWDSKPAKIKREILTMDYEKGGLKMIDLETFIKSLKICWIKRMIESEDNGILKNIYLSKLKPFGGKLLFECNFSENDIHRFTQNIFLKDILAAWCKCIENPVISSYRHEILWNNSNVKVEGNTIMYTNWFSNGIKYFEDVYDITAKALYSYRRLREKYNLPEGDFLKYLTLIHSMPNAWKTNIKNENVNIPKRPSILDQITKSKQTNQYTYKLLMKKKLPPERKSEQKWIEQFSDENLNWNNIYTSRLQATKDVRLQNFQYKCLMRIIPTNKYLLKCKLKETALCEFCSMEIETINHLFWECNHVQHFWTNLAMFLLRHNITINFSLMYVTFGITERTNCIETKVKNFIILLGKYFIFKNKYQGTQPTLEHFK